MPFLAAAICAGVLTLLSPAKAEASQFGALAQAISTSQPPAAALLPVGYYGGGDYYGDDQKDDYNGGDGGHHKRGYGSGGGYHKGGYGGSGYYGGGGGGYNKGGYGGGGYHGGKKYGDGDDDGGHGYHRKDHEDYPDGCCKGCYKKKWVCEESEPRCRKARECVWHYGKEYCRYVRRCHGGGDRYCKWVSYRSHNCGW